MTSAQTAAPSLRSNPKRRTCDGSKLNNLEVGFADLEPFKVRIFDGLSVRVDCPGVEPLTGTKVIKFLCVKLSSVPIGLDKGSRASGL